MTRAPSYDPLEIGQFAVMAGIASVALVTLWFALGTGRSGSLSACVDNGETVRVVIGWIAWAAIALTGVLSIVSLFTSSRWWGVSAVGIVIVCVPVIFVIAAILTYGDLGIDPDHCPF
jgi:hypothetical protein